MNDKTCSRCKQPIVVPHCESPTCTWCRGCHEHKLEECKK